MGRSELLFPLLGKVICPGCRRPLCTYVVTHPRGRTMVIYRYYRSRSTAGGRPPCRGVQVPAGEIEAVVREMLVEPTAWRPPRSSDLPNNAERLAVAWNSLDEVAQDDLLQHLVEQILLRRRMTEVRLTLCDSAIARLEARSPAPGGQLADEIESGRF